MRNLTTRRRVLRGMLGGAAVSVGLPFLDCFLNTNGTALASGAPLPTVFGSWFQNLGLNPGRWKPTAVGKGYQNNVELAVLDAYRERMNVISGTKYFLDGRPLETHVSGVQIATMGSIPAGVSSDPSLDTTIADVIGDKTRFKSIEISLSGGRQSLSRRKGGAINPSEPSPAALYARVFGPEFKDPNAAEFTPDTRVLARRSVLTAVADERKDIMKRIGAADRARLDEYFTAVRQIEQQLDLEMQKPAPLKDCSIPRAVPEAEVGRNVAAVERNNKLFAELLAHAVACGQTRVFNVNFGTQGLRTPGGVRDWHSLTHEEPIDPKLGYQRDVTWFINFATGTFARFLDTLDRYREGNGTVLDRALILWQTDHGYARTHTMDDLPILTVGNAGGRIKTGMHLVATGDPSTRVGLTVQQAFGVALNSWGRLSNATSKPLTEMLA
ncbi:MAG TPA: DUF1552 domain-containing protein [Povalibacter sp.]|nr:DUF1552 domain-containing protein [Povalibacter sp.]